MRILITGGAGFIGSHLLDAFEGKGHTILVVDNFSSGKREHIPASMHVANCDVTTSDFARVCKEFSPDIVYHLAAQKSVAVSVREPMFDAQINIMGSLNVCEAAIASGCKKFIFISSASVYALHQPVPVTEQGRIEPVSPYGIAKATIDYYLLYYTKVRGLTAASLRLANVYGPRQDPQGEAGVVGIFFEKLRHGQQCVINGTGEQTRDYIYVTDVATAAVSVLERSVSGIFNVGTGEQTSVNELYALAATVAGQNATPRHREALPGEALHSALDATRLQQAVSWQPEIDLQEGLRRTWDWFVGESKSMTNN